MIAPALKIAVVPACSCSLRLLDRPRLYIPFGLPPPPVFPAIDAKATGSTAGSRTSGCRVSGNATSGVVVPCCRVPGLTAPLIASRELNRKFIFALRVLMESSKQREGERVAAVKRQ